MDRQPPREDTETEEAKEIERAKAAERSASRDFILDDQKIKGLLEGPAGWLWRREWVEVGLANRRPDEDVDTDNPFHQRGRPAQ